MKNKLLFTALLLTSNIYAGFNFGECSGSKTFEQQIEHYGTNQENAITVGTIPKGIKGLHVKLISNKDVDIRLYGQNNDKVVHWPSGILRRGSQETKTYKHTDITYSGYNGDGTGKGHEFIKVAGTTPTAMIMKAFGYQSGYATVNYSWTGKEGCEAANNKSGHFTQHITRKAITLVGTIPKDIDNLEVKLTSNKDIDIQLYGADGTAIVKWPNGLLNGAGKDSITYNGMKIEWSGYNGDGTGRGHEYIKVTPKTTEQLTMKVYGYQAGVADVDYIWGIVEECGNGVRELLEECDDGNILNGDGCTSECLWESSGQAPSLIKGPVTKSMSTDSLSFKIKHDVAGIVQTTGCADLISTDISRNIETTFYFNTLSEGIYTKCKVFVIDNQGVTSSPLILPEFTVFRVMNTSLYKGRDDGKGLDYVIVSDGFTAGEMNTFRTKSKEYADFILNYDSKLKLEKNAWNIHLVELVSKESGADNVDGKDGTKVDTALDSSFWCNNIERLLCVNASKYSYVVSKAVPQFDKVLILVNSSKYGGAGGNYATVSLGGGPDVAIHELGHSLAGLGDEYTSGETTPPSNEPSAPNITINNNLNTVKWLHWVGDTAGVDGPIGLYEGGDYVLEGVWRSTKDSFMKTIGKPFYQVNAEAWALSVYKIAGVIYGKSPETQAVTQNIGANTTFTVHPSMGSVAQKITWTVNGVIQNIANDVFTMTYGAIQGNDYIVSALIEDRRSIIRVDSENVSKEVLTWNVSVN